MSKKKKAPTLAYQLRASVNNAFQEGRSKRADKLNSEDGRKNNVYSYNHRKDLIQFASQFAEYCKGQGVRMAYEINASHVRTFLEHKSKTCADSTLKTYYQHIGKLNKLVCKEYKTIQTNWRQDVQIPQGVNHTKQRDVKVSRESMDKVLDNLDLKYATHRGIILAESLGLRASEVSKIKGTFIDIEKRTVTVQGKGGRFREIPIPESRVEILSHLKEAFPESRICSAKPDSVNTTLKRQLAYADCHDLDDSKSGIHAVRKLWATEMYEEKIECGMSEKDAWGDISESLGHGRERPDLYKVYIVK